MDLKTYFKSERGAATKLAATLGISMSYLSQLGGGHAPLSPERCVEIEEATAGTVTRKDLRPTDWHRIWPELRTSDEPVAA